MSELRTIATMTNTNRCALTDWGPALIRSQHTLSAAQARKIFAQAGLRVRHFVRDRSQFAGCAYVIELSEEGTVLNDAGLLAAC